MCYVAKRVATDRRLECIALPRRCPCDAAVGTTEIIPETLLGIRRRFSRPKAVAQCTPVSANRNSIWKSSIRVPSHRMRREMTNSGTRLRPDSEQECRQSILSGGAKRSLLNCVWACLANARSRSSQLHKHVRLDDPNLAFENNLVLSRRTASVDPTDARDAPRLRNTYNNELNRCHILLRNNRF
jgi:hypothetical protein